MTDNRDRLKELGGLTGRLLLDPEVPFHELHVVIRSGDISRDRSVGPGGVFWLPGAQPGEATLEVKAQGMSWVLARMEGVKVRAGEKTQDPRLEGWDLRGRIRALVLKLKTADGRAIVDSKLWVKDEGGKGGQVETDGEGRLRLWIPNEPSKYHLKSEELGTAELQWNEPKDTEIVLN